MSKQEEFKINDEKKLFKYVIEASSLLGEKNSLGGPDIYHFDKLIYLVSDYIHLIKYPINDSKKGSIVRNSIYRFKGYSKKTLPYYKKALTHEIKRIEKIEPKEYSIVVPFPIKGKTIKKRHFIIDGGKIFVKSRKTIENEFQVYKLVKETLVSPKEVSKINHNYTYLVGNYIDKDEHDAVNKFMNKVELFRAVLNFNSMWFKHKGIFQSQPIYEPLSKVPPERIVFAFNKKEDVRKIYWNPDTDWTYPVPYKKVDDAFAIINQIDKIKSDEIRELVWGAISLYQMALDMCSRAHGFLHLWQILELISLSNDEDKPLTDDKIIKRIKSIMPQDNDIHKDILNPFMKKRNYLVHTGETSYFRLEEVMWLKNTCDNAINFLICNGNVFKDKQHLKEFYIQCNNSDKELSRRKKVINLIIKERNDRN
ncbi:MAG: hypothetical protein KAR56_02300 [Thermoplasmata archaeon]|nr:hypothetical protein [Thermoplasmata archaeon]